MSETPSSSFVELSVNRSPKITSSAAEVRRTHCEDFLKSGLNMSEYCRRSGLAISSLSGWIKKFNSAEKSKFKNKPEKLSPLVTRKQSLEIILISGIKLRLTEIVNIGEIIRLLKAVESCN